jgi:hypothetical protein
LDEILLSLRRLLVDHLATTEVLTADLAVGGDVVTVGNASRYRPGDEIFIMSTSVGTAEPLVIEDVEAWDTIRLESASQRGWTVAETSFIQKAIGHQPLKRVYVGDLNRIPDFPSITVFPVSEDNSWWALGATEHDQKVGIRIYAQTHNFERSEVLLAKYAKAVREILIDHIHPIINSRTEFFPLAADLPVGGTVVSISDTSSFSVGDMVFIRDTQPQPRSVENVIRTVLSPNQIEVSVPSRFEYLVARQAELLRVERYLYDTRPSSIRYGYVPGKGGSLLRGAEIGWYGKEVLCRSGNVAT